MRKTRAAKTPSAAPFAARSPDANGNVTAAARLLGVSRATLHRKLGRLGLS